MLPINGTASKNWSGTNLGGSNATTVNSAATANLGLSVNFFSWNSWINLKSANVSAAQAEATYLAAKQSLVQRATTRYFAVLQAQDQLAAQESSLVSTTRQLEQAERRFEVGLIAATDVQIARAARDSSTASVIAGRRSVAAAEEQLRIITGMKYASFSSPRADMPLLSPDPASEDAWVTSAIAQNASLMASRLQSQNSYNSYLTALGGHIPNVTLSAAKNWSLGGGTTTTTTTGPTATSNSNGVTWQAGVSVPIFTAGLTQSRVRAARYNYEASQAGYQNTERTVEQQTRDAYQSVISQIAQVQALSQAVESNRISLAATEAGYEVGTKTALDVLTSRQQLVQAQTQFAAAKYSYLNNLVALRLAAGSLDAETIRLINGWLAPRAAATPAGAAAAGGATPTP
jgi:outer membrane protein